MNDPRQPLQPPHAPQVRPLNGAPPPVAPRPTIAPIAPKPAVSMAPMPVEEPIELVADGSGPVTSNAPAPKKIVAFGVAAAHQQKDYKRKPYADGKGACRVKSFHAKYSEQGLDHLDDMINDWLEVHPEIEVKFSTTSVYTFEGKIREPALVVNVWY